MARCIGIRKNVGAVHVRDGPHAPAYIAWKSGVAGGVDIVGANKLTDLKTLRCHRNSLCGPAAGKHRRHSLVMRYLGLDPRPSQSSSAPSDAG